MPALFRPSASIPRPARPIDAAGLAAVSSSMTLLRRPWMSEVFLALAGSFGGRRSPRGEARRGQGQRRGCRRRRRWRCGREIYLVLEAVAEVVLVVVLGQLVHVHL